jgi:3-dehydroquinate synthase
MQTTHNSTIRFGSISGSLKLLPSERIVFITSSALREKASEKLPLEIGSGRWIEVPDGESCKTFSVLESVYYALLNFDAGSDTVLVAIGGGSVSDLAGFAAHTWKRGIELILVPTTLLAMIDASIGGKNAIDIGCAKNVVGSFHLPKDIICDVSWLRSLSERDLSSGMAEAVKHAVLDGEEHVRFFEQIAEAHSPLTELDGRTFEELVRLSQEVKLRYVKADPYDSKARHVLNYGHTFGHAIELLTGLPHGFAVAAGMGAANTLAVSRGALDPVTQGRIASLLRRFGLPAGIQEAFGMVDRALDRRALLELIRADKKRRGNKVDFVVPHGIGDVRVEAIPLDELAEALRV